MGSKTTSGILSLGICTSVIKRWLKMTLLLLFLMIIIFDISLVIVAYIIARAYNSSKGRSNIRNPNTRTSTGLIKI